jgi:lipopolysaccharide assembly protein A
MHERIQKQVSNVEDEMSGKLVLVVVIIVLVALFIIQNITAVSINFLAWSLSMNGALLFIIILILGIVIGWLLHSFIIFRKKGSGKK